MNEQIRITPIRLIGAEGEQHGIVPTAQALEMAREAGLDLVEVAAKERPPVCKIMDYGKFKYAQSKKSHQKDPPAEAQGNPRPPQDRRPRHRDQDQAGQEVPRAQRQGAGQRALPRPRDAAHRGRATGDEPGARSPQGLLQARVARAEWKASGWSRCSPRRRVGPSRPARRSPPRRSAAPMPTASRPPSPHRHRPRPRFQWRRPRPSRPHEPQMSRRGLPAAGQPASTITSHRTDCRRNPVHDRVPSVSVPTSSGPSRRGSPM